jgi:hypothetical protein
MADISQETSDTSRLLGYDIGLAANTGNVRDPSHIHHEDKCHIYAETSKKLYSYNLTHCSGYGPFSECSIQDGFSLHTNIHHLQLSSINSSIHTLEHHNTYTLHYTSRPHLYSHLFCLPANIQIL